MKNSNYIWMLLKLFIDIPNLNTITQKNSISNPYYKTRYDATDFSQILKK